MEIYRVYTVQEIGEKLETLSTFFDNNLNSEGRIFPNGLIVTNVSTQCQQNIQQPTQNDGEVICSASFGEKFPECFGNGSIVAIHFQVTAQISGFKTTRGSADNWPQAFIVPCREYKISLDCTDLNSPTITTKWNDGKLKAPPEAQFNLVTLETKLKEELVRTSNNYFSYEYPLLNTSYYTCWELQ
jgi:hypothetical protein